MTARPARITPGAIRHTDWPTILSDIALLLGEPDTSNPDVRIPVGSRLLSDHLGYPRTTVRNWLDGQEPRHADGEVLIDRWCRLTGKGRAFVPTQRASLSAAQMR